MSLIGANHHLGSRVVCLENGEDRLDGVDCCWLESQLEISYEALEKFCFTKLDPVDVDLLLLAGLVCYVDRRVKRKVDWVRSLFLEMPVHDPSFWSRDDVMRPLCEALRFVTGDFWSFKFRSRKSRDERALRLHFDSSLEAEGVVIPYSGGLDSFAEFRLFPSRHPGMTPLLVTAVHNSHLSELSRSTSGKQSCNRLRVPVQFTAGPHSEPSFRTRTFLFLVVSALAAKLMGSKAILVAENGQGAIGPSLIPSGVEHPFQSSHPGFTSRLMKFLGTLWGNLTPTISHPNKWLTKAQLLEEAAEYLGGWQSTKSCSCNTKRCKGSMAPTHCGLCSGCLLRRLALFSAQTIGADKEYYLWDDLEAPNMKESLGKLTNLVRPLSDNDISIAAAAIVDHRSLAELAKLPAECPPMKRGIRELSESTGTSEADVSAQLYALLKRHESEWARFVGSLGDKSWVAKLGDSRR